MNVQSVLLGFLMRKSMTGYDLKKVFSLSFSFFSGLSYGSIYPALKKMEKQGLITKRVESRDGAPNRKIYTITEAGRKSFLDALAAPLIPELLKSSFLMKLFFFSHLPPDERKAITKRHLESVEQMQGVLESARPEVKANADRFQYLCFEFGLRFFQALVGNISEVSNALEEDGGQPDRHVAD